MHSYLGVMMLRPIKWYMKFPKKDEEKQTQENVQNEVVKLKEPRKDESCDKTFTFSVAGGVHSMPRLQFHVRIRRFLDQLQKNLPGASEDRKKYFGSEFAVYGISATNKICHFSGIAAEQPRLDGGRTVLHSIRAFFSG